MLKKLLFILLPLTTYSQSIDIAELTVKVPMLSEDFLYYGFAEGDQIVFNFQEINGKELKELEISELDGSSKLLDYKTKKLENKILTVASAGIYKFRFYNSSLGSRVCKMKIQRIPASDKTQKFNSTVYWKTVVDTTYTPVEEKYLEKSEQIATEVYTTNTQISSQTAVNGNSNHQVVNFQLPENTIAWSFYIGTGIEGKAEYERAKQRFLKAATSLAEARLGVLGSLAMNGVSYFINNQGENNVKYWFISDLESVQKFKAYQSFYSYKSGDVISEASQMLNPKNGKVYLGLVNDNIMEPIQVTIKVVAVQLVETWNTRINQVMSLNQRKVAFLKN